MSEQNASILIVEDERPMVQALTLKLEKEGYQVTSVSNGEEALAALEGGNFNLILCDLVMPKMDGFAFLRAMNEREDTTPVVILTNLSQKEDEVKVKELGAKGFFVKSDTPIKNIIDFVNDFLM